MKLTLCTSFYKLFYTLAVLIVGSALLGGCKSDPSSTTTDSSLVSDKPTADNPSAAKPNNVPELTSDIPDSDIATEEDFDEEVTKTITASTDLTGALDALEKEIGQ